jgi:DNA-binding SARP family transcriptional activator
MEFRILGNLELVSNGEVIDLGGNRLRAFVASVLIHACEPVTYDKLSAYIWDEPPSSAPANLRTYATALRRKLADAERGADRWLKTTSGTYQLILDPRVMDATIFNCLVAESDRHFKDGDVAQAVDELDRALRLWRGRPMQNVRGSWLLSAEVACLEERYLAAAERRADLFFTCRHHADSVRYLRDLVSEFPLNERLWSRLIRALAISDRRADALDAYHYAREQIADSTGMEPGLTLRSIYMAILKGEPV